MKNQGKRNERRYVVVIEKTKNNYGAYVPDLPGCVAVAKTKEELRRLIREAIKLHIESLQEDRVAIPHPATTSEYVEVRV